jgi:asparagine synthase (glutamine-hydrolysing)
MMSGIAGIVGRKATRDELQEMIDKVTHRGPDRKVVKELPNGGAAACEMSISPRSTPVMAGTEEPIVLFDGEIYNRLPEDASNVSFIRDCYLRDGKECFAGLDGSFTCAIIDGEEVILVRDGVGARPMNYHVGDGALYFASEAKALLGLTGEVEELPPAHTYSTREGLRRFQGYAPAVPEFETPGEAAAILRDLVIEAVRKRMADGAVKGVSLSGGLDSSIVAAIAKSIDPSIKLFSTTIKRYPSDDIRHAKMIAEFLGLEHHIYEISDEDISALIPKAIWYMETFDEDCVSGAIANFCTSRMISDFTHTILVGEGADELFGGYFRELPDIADEREKERIARKLVEIAYNTALRRLDRGWLANSVNYRTPFLDPKVVAFSEKVPMALKVCQDVKRGAAVEKWILREAFREWLPPEIANRPKLRFAGGTGVDDRMDELAGGKVTEEEFRANPSSESGLPLNSSKELHYYRLFREHFPKGFEKLTVRWDPFK